MQLSKPQLKCDLAFLLLNASFCGGLICRALADARAFSRKREEPWLSPAEQLQLSDELYSSEKVKQMNLPLVAEELRNFLNKVNSSHNLNGRRPRLPPEGVDALKSLTTDHCLTDASLALVLYDGALFHLQ